MSNETQSERKIRAHAAHLRRKFEGSTEVIRGIVSQLSDLELIEAERRNHEVRLQVISTTSNKECKR